jgi:hypothetical protein
MSFLLAFNLSRRKPLLDDRIRNMLALLSSGAFVLVGSNLRFVQLHRQTDLPVGDLGANVDRVSAIECEGVLPFASDKVNRRMDVECNTMVIHAWTLDKDDIVIPDGDDPAFQGSQVRFASAVKTLRVKRVHR